MVGKLLKDFLETFVPLQISHYLIVVLQTFLLFVCFINGVLILFFNLFVDISLWFVVRANIDKTKSTASTVNIRKKSRVEANLAKMIIINGTCSFFLRLPVVLTYIADVIFTVGPKRKDLTTIIFISDSDLNSMDTFMMNWLYIRESIIDITDNMYGVSCILPIFFYWRYNTGFRISLQKRLAMLTFACSLFYFSSKF